MTVPPPPPPSPNVVLPLNTPPRLQVPAGRPPTEFSRLQQSFQQQQQQRLRQQQQQQVS